MGTSTNTTKEKTNKIMSSPSSSTRSCFSDESILREFKSLQEQSPTALEPLPHRTVLTNKMGEEKRLSRHDQAARYEIAQARACRISENLQKLNLHHTISPSILALNF